MSKRKKSSDRSGKVVNPNKTSSANAGKLSFWVRHRGTIIALAGLYLLIAIFFSPVVVQNMTLSPAPDMMAVAGMNKIGEEAIKDFRFPLWNPTLYCGLPLFASLQYALFTYPPEYFIRAFSYIFGPSHYRVWLFHYLLAGVFTYLLARHFKRSRFASWIAGVAYAFSPQLLVLVDVGHGSKLMGMTYLPLIWLLIDRLRQKPIPARAALLGAVFAVEILALHPQVAAYGGMMMGLYLIYYGVISFIKHDIGSWLKTAGLWLGSMLLSLAISAILWVSVLDYARYSIRGAGDSGVGGAGVTWDYATGWSFHPIETITYFFPSFFGFSGGTYWGTVGTPAGQPFTQNPMYFGIVIVFLAILSMTLLNRKTWGFPITLGLAAWVLSFGKYLPILYGPLFHLLPLFNKFRAPVMGQVLVLLPMAVLAAYGWDAITDKIKNRERSPIFARAMIIVMVVLIALTIISTLSESVFHGIYQSVASMVRSDQNQNVLNAAEKIARTDVMRVMAFLLILSGLVWAALERKVHLGLLMVVTIGILIVDLWTTNRKLISFHTSQQQNALFQPEGVVRHLKRSTGKFRVHALDNSYPAVYWQRELGIRANTNPANWLSYWDIESTTGYFGAKPSNYQALMTRFGFEARIPYSWLVLFQRPQLLDVFNVRYILTTYPLNLAFEELEKQGMGTAVRKAEDYVLDFVPRDMRPGSGAYLYKNPYELERARVVDRFQVIEDFNTTLDTMLTGNWDPITTVLLDRKPESPPQPGGVSNVNLLDYKPEKIKIKVDTSVPKLLVLADAYYPSGWVAKVDGEPTEIMRANGVFRSIMIPAGSHDVTFTFKPKLFYFGLYISLATVIGLLIWGVLWFLGIRKKDHVKIAG